MTDERINPEENTIEQNNPDDELLTAYLDEELTDAEKAETEKRLAADPQLKKRLEKLRAAGKFLDALELVPPSRELTATTMEILTGVIQREIRASEKRRRRHNLILISLVLLAGCAVFFLTALHDNTLSHRDAAQNSKDYPIYSHLDALKAVQTITLLRQLSEIPFFNGTEPPLPGAGMEEGTAQDQRGKPSRPDFSRPVPPPPQKMTKTNLLRQQTQFNTLSKNERERYKNLWSEIDADPDHEKLIYSLETFGAWFQTIPESEQSEFWLKPESERAEFAEFLFEEIGPLPPFDLSDPMSSSKNMLPSPRGIFGRKQRGPINLKMLLPKEVRSETLDIQDDFDTYIESLWKENSLEELFREKPKRVILDNFINEKGLDFFTAKLSDKGKAYIETLQESQKHILIAVLIQASLCDEVDFDSDPKEGQDFLPPPRGMMPPGPPSGNIGSFWKRESTAALAETLRRLPEEERKELLSLPADEMYSQLLFLHWGFDPKHGPPLPGLFGRMPPSREDRESPPKIEEETLNK